MSLFEVNLYKLLILLRQKVKIKYIFNNFTHVDLLLRQKVKIKYIFNNFTHVDFRNPQHV